MKLKRTGALLVAASMSAALLAGCGQKSASTDSSDGGGQETEKSQYAGQKITFLNSKGEIQTALEDMAKKFQEESGIEVEIVACGAGESPYTKVTSAYNSGNAPTMAMLDTTDIVALAKEYAMDLSSEKWVSEADGQLTKIDDKVYSFPFCVEGRGIIYNKAAIEDVLGEDFNPASINSYDSFKALLEKLRAKGMENPVVISKEDWSLGAHQLGFIYDTYDGTTAGSEKLINELKAGTLKVEDYDRFNEFVNTMDLLLEYNVNKKDPLGAIYDQDPIFLADKEAAFWANGCWAWPNLAEAGADESDGYGFLPFFLGNDTSDFANTGIQASASKQVMIDKVQAKPEQQEAAKEFLNWIVYSKTGQKMLVEDCALIPACKNNEVAPIDPLGQDIKAKMAQGHTYSSSYIAPSDHWSALGAAMQKYISGGSTKEQLAAEIDTYWTSQK